MAKARTLWRIWFAAVGIAALALTISFFVSQRVFWCLLWTLGSAESAIFLWQKIGVSTTFATLIAILIGNVDLANWFWLSDRMMGLTNHVENHFHRKSDTHKTWIRKIVGQMPYLFLFGAGLVPGQIFLGIAVTKIFHLNVKSALAVMATGNTTKMVLSGLGIWALR